MFEDDFWFSFLGFPFHIFERLFVSPRSTRNISFLKRNKHPPLVLTLLKKAGVAEGHIERIVFNLKTSI